MARTFTSVESRKGDLTPIRVPQGPYRELRHLAVAQANYAQSRKLAKQRIQALLLYAHLTGWDSSASWSHRHIQALKEVPCTPAVRCRLDLLLADLEYARGQTLAVLKQAKEFCLRNPEIERYRQCLQSLPGIGFITAITILSRIGNPHQLQNVRELAAFVGLVPTEHSTGDRVNRGSITHLGNRTARSLLIEAAWVAIHRDAELGQFYYRIKGRNHPRIAARKAIVAVARKLITRIYCVLKEQRPYEIH